MPVATFDKDPIENIRVDQLDIKKGEIPGSWVKGGPIEDFHTTGILDRAKTPSLTVVDGAIIVDSVNTKSINGDVSFII